MMQNKRTVEFGVKSNGSNLKGIQILRSRVVSMKLYITAHYGYSSFLYTAWRCESVLKFGATEKEHRVLDVNFPIVVRF